MHGRRVARAAGGGSWAAPVLPVYCRAGRPHAGEVRPVRAAGRQEEAAGRVQSPTRRAPGSGSEGAAHGRCRMTDILVTGAAGFIGFHTCQALLARGDRVLGVDNLNAYYDPALKRARLAELAPAPGFTFVERDLAAPGELLLVAGFAPSVVVHLAGQVGVRSSLTDPAAHVRDNLAGQFEVLEYCRQRQVQHLVHASTSAVYGGNRELPLSVEHRVDDPISFYAATKRGGELLARSWAGLHGLSVTSLRFFTVYGPWGRPDMATWTFVDRILRGQTIRLHGHADMRRSFTWIEDAVAGILGAVDRVPRLPPLPVPHRLYNIGNPESVELRHYLALIEAAVGRPARVELVAAEPGEMRVTEADIGSASRDLGFWPRTPVATGVPRFVAWFRAWHA